ncbi:hypothetical protein F4553_003178 [Allocatelliglobosispora scoriae]|uniref:Lipoprotein n=1 Tax=Allocatelliglobosispora scoriae TaxID=643052 RepID=A0A841BRH7_9ACTN|nr:hypothetical protein [Allocatelliglobosispora scoriae]MBB5869799.1 hypothetical protein [Allocatelliglobosispora scoriae]
MRRVIALMALVGALFTASACSAEPDPAASPSATAAAGGKTNKEVCASLGPKVTAWATDISGLKEVTKESTAAEKEAFFTGFNAATRRLIESLLAASAEASDKAFQSALNGLVAFLETGSKTFTAEAIAKGAKNPYEGAEFEAAAGELDKYCS